jgi:hypothetical protein
VSKVFKELRVLKELLVLKELKDLKVLQVSKENLEQILLLIKQEVYYIMMEHK